MRIIIYIVTLFLVISSCSDSFTDLASENNSTTDSFYKTPDDFNAAIMAAYAKLQGQVGLYFELSEWRSDNLDLGAPTAGTQDRYNINKFQETSANELIRDAWANYYNGIFRANSVTDNLGGVNFDEILMKQYEAEARFIRALTYFNIVRLWGDAPIISSVVSSEESLKIGRSPVTEVYQFIEEDLQFAANNLPSSYPAQDYGRATSGAAKTLLGKVYLTQKKYGDAVTVLNGVLGEYGLLNNVADVFDTGNKNNSEIIFSIRFNKEIQGEGHGLWFAVSDISISPFTSKIINAYTESDARKDLIDYVPAGNLLVPAKFFDTESSFRNFGNDYILLRHADVLLMLSEALNEQGYQSGGTAFSYLNEVRERSNLTPLTATDLPDQARFREAVLQERFLEFPFEGHRWFDLVRTNTAASEINSGIGVVIQDYQLLYPVPQAEIEKINNTSIFYQNNGY
ncbi:RagB/SusD family nutrient uptake outer membrane protein [Aestuariivivens sediminis]|uniref:RagB/SusD family nutrient uptake outer membrane protein n=1 Tax=Aestuariivivens sediminis TaxID=2913557 RepID=UPI001F586D52|nr:RagB/SusD family nutrient uptake outer membrane protein [Aestuariivivens sediminis]